METKTVALQMCICTDEFKRTKAVLINFKNIGKMSVDELNDEQLDQLRHAYFYQLLEMDEDVLGDIDTPYGIPIENVKQHYEGIYFVEEDFNTTE